MNPLPKLAENRRLDQPEKPKIQTSYALYFGGTCLLLRDMSWKAVEGLEVSVKPPFMAKVGYLGLRFSDRFGFRI